MPQIKEEYERVKLNKEDADKVIKKATNGPRDKIISVGIVIALIIALIIFILSSLRNHAANSLYERVYGYEDVNFSLYLPENETDTFTIDGEEIVFDSMRSKLKFDYEGNMVWRKSFDTDLSGGESFTKEYVSTHTFTITSDALDGEPYILLDDGTRIEIILEDVIGQPISSIKYMGK